jgi:hypothetical protein
MLQKREGKRLRDACSDDAQVGPVRCRWPVAGALLGLLVHPDVAGPPFVSDDSEPTDTGHFEIYTFDNATNARAGTTGEAGIDFNYGTAPDLQLTATGCTLNEIRAADFCQAGAVLTYQVLPKLQIGGELFQQTADSEGAPASTSVGTSSAISGEESKTWTRPIDIPGTRPCSSPSDESRRRGGLRRARASLTVLGPF